MLLGYLALSRRIGFARSLDPRTRMVAEQLAAELSGCRWCIERGRHDWRRARLPPILLRRLRDHATCPLFPERERVELAFIEAVSRCDRGESGIAESVLAQVRRFFSEGEIAELARCLADHHFLDDSIP
jgi:alkylhydroperoxidase family enzyme